MGWLHLALILALLSPSVASADPGWTVHPGQGLEGGDALYCNAPCDIYGTRNVQAQYRLDLAAGNSNLSAGSFVAGSIAFCWDITCTTSFYNGQGVPLVQVTPTHTDFRAPNGELLMRFSNRGISLYKEPHLRYRHAKRP